MKNILVVKLSAIGDVIHALPVSYAIKETFPDVKLTWVVEPPSYDLLTMNPCVDEIIVFHKKEFKSIRGFLHNIRPFRRTLRLENYDAVLDLQGLFKSAAIAHVAKAPVKLGMCNMRELSSRVSKPVVGPNAYGHIVERYLDVARALGCGVNRVVFPVEVPQEAVDSAVGILANAGVQMEYPYVVFVIGANWPNKVWPVQHFAELGDWFLQNQVTPVIVGNGAADMRRAIDVSGMMRVPPVNLVDKTNLKELAHIIKGARLVIGGDTGPVHLASGMGVRTIMLMGPTDAKRNGPYGQLQNAIEVDRPCRYCWKRACMKDADCLERITVQHVEQKIMQMS